MVDYESIETHLQVVPEASGFIRSWSTASSHVTTTCRLDTVGSIIDGCYWMLFNYVHRIRQKAGCPTTPVPVYTNGNTEAEFEAATEARM
jgi:hypothetical protein